MGSLFNGLFREAALAFARHFIAGFGVWLVARHYASQADATRWLGAVMTAIGLGWSFYDKWSRARRLQAARALIAPAS